MAQLTPEADNARTGKTIHHLTLALALRTLSAQPTSIRVITLPSDRPCNLDGIPSWTPQVELH